MVTKRKFLKALGLASTAGILSGLDRALAMNTSEEIWFMPDESEPHHRTWMAYGASIQIWERRLLPEVQRNLANIALSISEYEPVSMLVRQSDLIYSRKIDGFQG